MNEALDGKIRQFVYAAGFKDSEGLYKINTETAQVLEWAEKGCNAGEPVFVPSPGAHDEDDGLILSIVSNHTTSFLLILDAKSFKEIARATAPHVIPEGLHGQYFKE